uniref:ATP binding cassette subfamily B member 10 n=1 Tax=Lepisosteus oculatus TaxID=7918 RepID=W5NEH3_LEPOC
MQTSGQQIVRNLRESLFSSILRQEVGFFDKTRTGELVNRLSADTALIGRAVTDNLSDGLRAVAQATAGVGMMFFVSPSLAAFVLMIIPPLAALAVVYGRYLRSLSQRTQDSLADATQLAEERIGNLRTVRAFGKEFVEVDKYVEKINYVLQLARKEAVVRAGFFGATGLSGNLIVLSVLYKGGLLMASEHMTVGELSSFLMYAFWVGVSISGLSSFYSELMKGFGAGVRLWELLDRKPEFPLNAAEGIALRPEQLKGELEFRDVTFSYPTRQDAPVFRGLSLSVPAGSVMAVVGPSGSGKSTLVSLLLRLYDPDSGVIAVDGYDIRDLNPYCLRSNIGTVSQEPVLFSGSIAENIAYGAPDPSRVSAQDIHRAAQIANAHGFVQHFPRGYDTMVGEKGILLSVETGGQKQRIAIARAVLKNPKILLLDEATSALDAENEFLVQEALDRLMQGRTVLIIAHRLSTIQNADAVAVLDQRRVVECGRHEELLANRQGLFRKLVEKQAFLQNSQNYNQCHLKIVRCFSTETVGLKERNNKVRAATGCVSGHNFGQHRGGFPLFLGGLTSPFAPKFWENVVRNIFLHKVNNNNNALCFILLFLLKKKNRFGILLGINAAIVFHLMSHKYSVLYMSYVKMYVLVCPSEVVDCFHISSAALGFLVISSTVTMSAPFFLGILSGQQIVRNLRGSLFNSILRQEVGFFDKTRTGELINRLSADTVVIGHSITDNLSDGLRAVAQATAGVGMMFYMSPKLAAFVLMIVPPLAVLAVVYGRYLRSLSKRTQDALADSTQLAEERIGNVRTVRAFGKESMEVEKY